MPSTGTLKRVLIAGGGFFAAKAIDWFNRDWTYNATTNVQMREIIKDAAATGSAIAASMALKAVGLAKGEGSGDALLGGLLYALNRGITERGKAATLDGFSKHLLTDFVDASGNDMFDPSFDADLGHFGVPGAFLEDYLTEDDLGDDDFEDDDAILAEMEA